MEQQLIKKRFDLQVTAAQSKVSETFELDKNIKNIKGILLTSDKEDILYFRGTQKLLVNSLEIFPENYESRLLMSGINVSPNDRYYKTCIPTGNGKVQIEYIDKADGRTGFQSHRVSLYLLCETTEDDD